jgi:hypothetical protein
MHVVFEVHKRRGNLPSLTNRQEFFNGYKTRSLQSQSREIASWMQQRWAELNVLHPPLKLAMTKEGVNGARRAVCTKKQDD